MHNKSMRRCFYVHALLTAMVLGGLSAGCGGADPLAETSSALSTCGGGAHHLAGAYGSKPGGLEGYACTVGVTTPVTFINGYADSERVYGIELKWNTTFSKLYGRTNDLDPQPLNTTDDPIAQIKVCVDSNNLLSGILFKTVSNTAPSPLILGRMCGAANQTAFDDIDDVLTNMATWSGTFLTGVKFVYTGPANP